MTGEKTIQYKADDMFIKKLHKRNYVMRRISRYKTNYPDPNFHGMSAALCGVLGKTESFKAFKERWIKQKVNEGRDN